VDFHPVKLNLNENVIVARRSRRSGENLKKSKRINFLFMKKDGYGNFVQYF
jgi:hypothetical protein